MFKNYEFMPEHNIHSNIMPNHRMMGMDDMNWNMNMMGSCQNKSHMHKPVCCPVQERCIHKTILHEVPHICPIRTRVINHHVYKHTYHPEYSCQEENVVSNVQCGSCNQFR